MKIKKCFIALITALAVVCTFFPVGVSADDKVYPVKTDVEWFSVGKIVSIDKGEEVFSFSAPVNGQEMKFYLSFPAEGGFRLYTDLDGVFQPAGLNKIEYGQNPAGRLTLGAPDGTCVTLTESGDTWQLAVSNGGNEVLKLENEEILFGYALGEIEHVKIISPLHSGEALYGFGERFNAVNQVGYQLQLWNLDNTYHASDNNLETKVYSYINAPILHSTMGYTVFMNSAYCVDADLGVSDPSQYSLESYGPKFDLYYWTADPVENIQSYTALTGRSFLPPRWAFSYWAGATNHVWKGTDNGKGQYISILQSFLNGYKKLGIPTLEAIYTESVVMFDPVAYSILKKNGTRMLMWTSGYFDFQTILNTLGVVDSEAPVVWSSINPWTYNVVNADKAFLDHTNPLATEFMKKYLKQYVEWGCRGMMVDMGEKIPEDSLFSNGMSGKEMHNFSSYYYLKSVNDAMTELLDGEKDFILFQRSGCAGSQAFGANFLGDNNGHMSGLKQQINAGLSLSASGFGIWGGDIGGFNATDSMDTYLRWLEFSVFEPLMREHGVATSNPWEFGGVAEEVFKKQYWLRENLIDTIYSAAANCNAYGTPMAQTLAMVYPDQTALHSVWDEYLFCDNLLVCPVTENDSVFRDVTFPEGTWYSLWDGESNQGGVTVTASAPQDRIPVYLKSGAVMPVKVANTYQLTDSMADGEPVSALVVTPPETETSFEAWDDTAESSIVYTNSPKKKNTFTVSAGQKSDISAILAYGVAADTVRVDGVYLPRVSAQSGKTGFYVDNGGKTVIVLPRGKWSRVEISGADIKAGLVNVAANATFTDSKNDTETTVLASLKTDDSTYQWSASTASGTYLMLELEQKYEIDSMVFKWGSGYASEYTVETSADGKSWETVYEASDGSGGTETVSFGATKAKYIRISNFKRGGSVPASLYNVTVYQKSGADFSFRSSYLYYGLSTAAALLTGSSVPLLLAGIVLVLLSAAAVIAATVIKVRRRKT